MKKIKAALNARPPMSDETRAKMSRSAKLRVAENPLPPLSLENIEKNRVRMTGRVVSEETRARQSAAGKVRKEREAAAIEQQLADGQIPENGRYITAFGKTQSITEWARETGIGLNVLTLRLNRGMNAETALTKPVRPMTKNPPEVTAARKVKRLNQKTRESYTAFGRTQTMTEWANEIGITQPGLAYRLKQMTLEEALTAAKSEKKS